MDDVVKGEQESGWSTEAVLQNLAWIRRMAGRLVAGSDAADDLAQEVWVRSLQKPAPAGVAPRAWLAGILRRTSVETRRSAQRRRTRESLVARPDSDEDAGLEQQVAIERDLVEHVLALEEPLRRTVLLRYFQGLDVKRLAAQEGLTESGVQSRLNRAYGVLRRQLRQRSNSPAGLWFAGVPLGKSVGSTAAGRSAEASSFWKVAASAALVLTVVGAATYAALDGPRQAPAVAPLEIPESTLVDTTPPSQLPESDEVLKSMGPALTEPQGRVAIVDVLGHGTGPSTVAAASEESGLRVRVESSFGAALPGIPVVMDWTDLPIPAPWEGTTGPTGQTEVPPAALQSARAANNDQPFRLRVAGIGIQATEVELSLDDLPSEVVTLVLSGGVGSLEFFVESPLALAGPVSEDTAGKEAPVSLQLYRGTGDIGLRMPRFLRGAAGETIVVPCVGLGHSWTVRGRVGSRHELAQLSFEGPTTQGERKRINLAAEPPWPTLTGTIAAANALPLGEGVALKVEIFDLDGQPIKARTHQTLHRKNGHFAAGLEIETPAGTPCRYRLELADRTGGAPPLEAWKSAHVPAMGEVYDLGKVPFEPAERTLHGIVLNEAGQPVPNARVLVWVPEIDSDYYPWSPNFGGIGRSNSDGAFTIPLPMIEGTFGVSAKIKNGVKSPIVEVTDPNEPIELVAIEPRRVAGQLAPVEGVRLNTLLVEVQEFGAPSASLKLSVNPSAEGHFLIEGLTSDTVDLVVRSELGGPVAARLEGVDLGGGAADPRLSPWEWREGTQQIDFQVFGAGGIHLKHCLAWIDGQSPLVFHGGRVKMLLADDVFELNLRAQDHADMRVELATIGDFVEMESLPVSLTFDDPQGVLEGYKVQLLLPTALGPEALKGLTRAQRIQHSRENVTSPRKPIIVGAAVELFARRAGLHKVCFIRPNERYAVPEGELPQSLRGLQVSLKQTPAVQSFRFEVSAQ